MTRDEQSWSPRTDDEPRLRLTPLGWVVTALAILIGAVVFGLLIGAVADAIVDPTPLS